MILVDSSVWVAYFNGQVSAETDHLDAVLGTEPVAIGDLMLTERCRRVFAVMPTARRRKSC